MWFINVPKPIENRKWVWWVYKQRVIVFQNAQLGLQILHKFASTPTKWFQTDIGNEIVNLQCIFGYLLYPNSSSRLCLLKQFWERSMVSSKQIKLFNHTCHFAFEYVVSMPSHQQTFQLLLCMARGGGSSLNSQPQLRGCKIGSFK